VSSGYIGVFSRKQTGIGSVQFITLTTTVPLAMLFIVGAALIDSSNPVFSTARAEETTSVSEADMNYFYRNPSPEEVARLMAYFDGFSDKLGAQPSIIGFLAAAFRRYPSDIDKMIPEGLSPRMLGVAAIALRLANQGARAQSVVDHLRGSGAAVPDLGRIPSSLDAVAATGPGEFDMFWGASLASGDPRYSLKILDHFAAIANVDGNAEDMVTIARSQGTGADMDWLVKKRGADKARNLIEQSTALWSINSNARQHEFIRVAVDKYIAEHPEEPASKALVALAQDYGHYDVKKIASLTETAPGKHSVSVNLVYLSQVLDDLARHAGSFPPYFAFPEDRQRAEGDVSAISALLDPLSQDFSQSPPLQLRLGLLHAIGLNLDIPGSYEKAVAAFSTLMKLTPNDPQANYQYGAFLAAITRKGEGIPFLEKAKALGVLKADYWLGMSYAVMGDKAKAIENLESYTIGVPSDQNAARILDAMRNDRFKVEQKKTSP
jgi:tetratricopeptide (TPR) repeat protein